MSYDVCIQRRGQKYIAECVRTFSNKREAVLFARDLSNYPADTIHYAVTCEDGRTIWDTSKQGLLPRG